MYIVAISVVKAWVRCGRWCKCDTQLAPNIRCPYGIAILMTNVPPHVLHSLITRAEQNACHGMVQCLHFNEPNLNKKAITPGVSQQIRAN